jgi:hypothetical protein
LKKEKNTSTFFSSVHFGKTQKQTRNPQKEKAATVHTLSTARPVVWLAEVEFKLNRNRVTI